MSEQAAVMERRSVESREYTLRGKLWMMVVLLGVVNCVCGGAIFLVSSLLSSAAWIPVLITVFVSTLTTAGFAWLISNDVLRPLDRLNLLAKSIERSPGMSVPHTTGAVETDDLLHTISRASRQLTNFVDLMDEVTSGNTKIALDPLAHSDRLSESFRKLVAKVTDSIDAKAELDRLQRAVNQISGELTGLQRGEAVRIKNEFEGTKTITDALRFLVERHAGMTRVLSSNAAELRSLAGETRNRMTLVMDKDAARDRLLKKVSSGLIESGAAAEAAVRDLTNSLGSVHEVLDQLDQPGMQPEENAAAQTAIRRQFDAALHKLRGVGEQSLAITHVAKAVQDLAKRSNMIALNSSIQANDENSAGLAALTHEITSLSDRAEKANKAIAGIGDSIVRDVTEANASIQWLTAEVSKFAARTADAEESIGFVRETLLPMTEIAARVKAEANERSANAELHNKMLEDCSVRSEEVTEELRSCEANCAMLQQPLDAIREAVGSGKQVLTPITNGTEHSVKNGGNGNHATARELITLAGEK